LHDEDEDDDEDDEVEEVDNDDEAVLPTAPTDDICESRPRHACERREKDILPPDGAGEDGENCGDDEDGINVGTKEGSSVGVSVGTGVGADVGMNVGKFVGGREVGEMLGAAEG